MKNWVELTCAGCLTVFPKSAREYDRQVAKGRTRFFCTTSCQVGFTNTERYGVPQTTSERKTLVELSCSLCGTPFFKESREVSRWKRKGRIHFFCSPSCSTSNRNKTAPNVGNLRQGGITDDMSPFRWFLLRVRSRRHLGDHDLTLEYLKDLWNSQSGTCPFTGWTMVLPRVSNGFEVMSPKNASLDRVDCSVGYVVGNVRFVSLIANLARSQFTDDDVLDFSRSVVERSQSEV